MVADMPQTFFPRASISSIPAELRLRIYELVLEEDSTHPAQAITQRTPRILLSFTQVCQILRQDLTTREIRRIMEVSIQVNTFHFHGFGDLHRTTANLMAQYTSDFVQNLQIHHCWKTDRLVARWLFSAAAWGPLQLYWNLRYFRLFAGSIDSISCQRSQRWLDTPGAVRQQRYNSVFGSLLRNFPYIPNLLLEIDCEVWADSRDPSSSWGSIVSVTLRYGFTATGTWRVLSAPEEREAR